MVVRILSVSDNDTLASVHALGVLTSNAVWT